MKVITFKKFIGEDSSMTLEEAVSIVKSECKPFLSKIDEPLWRGVRLDSNTPLVLRSVRKDRVPKDSEQWLHDALNKMLFKKTGIHFRSEAAFASFSVRVANGYGDSARLIFPIGKFDYCFSPAIDDAFNCFADGQFKNNDEVLDLLIPFLKKNYPSVEPKDVGSEEDDLILPRFIEEELAPLYEFNKGIEKIYDEKNEVMISCQNYFILDEYAPAMEGISPKEFFELVKED